jgi:nitric oxide dioxygenase
MTPEQMQIVRLTFAQAGAHRFAVEREFYRGLFVIAPDLCAHFHGDIDAESVKLQDALALAFGALTNMPFLIATLEGLARRDVARGLPERHFRAIAKALLGAIENRIGPAFTPRVCDAWIALFAVVVTFLRGPVAGLQSARAA